MALPARLIRNEVPVDHAFTTSILDLRTRHRRAFLAKQRRMLRRDDENKIADDGDLGDESPFEDDTTRTGSDPGDDRRTTSTATSTTVTSVEAQPITVTPSSAVQASAQATSTLQSTTQTTSSTTSNHSPAVASSKSSTIATTLKPTISQAVSAAPEVEDSTTSKASTTSRAGLETATGVPASVTITSSKMPGGEVASIVLLLLASLAVAGGLFWYFRRRRNLRANASSEYPDEKAEQPTGFLGIAPPQRSRLRSEATESRIWGGATTQGAPTEAGDIPEFVPASMQPGGVYDLSGSTAAREDFLARMRARELAESNSADSRETATAGVPPPSLARGGVGSIGDDGLIRPPSTWLSRDSIASVPRFRDIQSWAQDQTGRTGGR